MGNSDQISVDASHRRIVLCGSMSAYGDMQRIERELVSRGVRTVLPEADEHIREALSEEAFEQFKREVSFAHLRRIRNPATYAVLAVNVDRHGIADYIGPNTFAEIAVAFAQRKRIFLLQDAPAVYSDELSAWGAVCLNGAWHPLIQAFQDFCFEESRQLSLL